MPSIRQETPLASKFKVNGPLVSQVDARFIGSRSGSKLTSNPIKAPLLPLSQEPTTDSVLVALCMQAKWLLLLYCAVVCMLVQVGCQRVRHKMALHAPFSLFLLSSAKPVSLKSCLLVLSISFCCFCCSKGLVLLFLFAVLTTLIIHPRRRK